MGLTKLRLGIVGCGLIGAKRAISAKGHSIEWVADTDLDKARQLASKCGAEVSKDWRMLVKKPLDAVIVSTSHDSLAEISIEAIRNNKHILVEKPAGRNAGEVKLVQEAALEHKRIVKVGYNHRFHPGMLKARSIFDSGALGTIMFVRGFYGHGGRPGYEKEWRCNPEISGGGELVDQGSHLIDLSRWFLGELHLAFSATPTYFWDMAADDNCFLALKTDSDQLAWLHASWSEWKNSFCFQIYGKNGKLTVEGLGGSYGTERLIYHRMLPEMGPPETSIWEFSFPDRSWDLEFSEFERAIASQTQPVGSIADALAVMKIIDNCYARE